MRSSNPREFLSREESALVEKAVAASEAGTTGQIKVVVVRHCWGKIEDKARRVFRKEGLHRTTDRNCVLILLVTANREFMIYGDSGIHDQAGQGFWDEIRDQMAARFRRDAFGEGLREGIELIGRRLAQKFPPREGRANEISDEIALEE